MLTLTLKIAAVMGPALMGVVAAFIGSGSVHRLRQSTGDTSVLTKVLSGDFVRHDG